MKRHPCNTQRRVLRTAIFAASLAILAFSGGALAASVSQSGEQKNMRRVGHTDLQGRPGYQPNVIQYPDGRFIAFAGTHSNIPVTRPGFTFLPNPLNNNADEPNGTMIIDVTDPSESEGDVPYSGSGRRRPGANGAHVPGVRPERGPKGQGLFDAQHSGKHRLRVRSLGRDRCQKAGARVGAAGHSLHAQALVGVQHRHRLHARQQGLRAAMASIAVNGDRRLEKSARCLQSTSARSVWSVGNQARPGQWPLRSMVRSRRTSILMRPASSPVGPRPTTSSGTASTRHGASATTAC